MVRLGSPNLDLAMGVMGRPPFRRAGYALGHEIAACPSCGSGAMDVATGAAAGVRYRCEACGRCWMLGFEGVYRVDAVLCPGCAHREACFERLRQDIPTWWWPPIEE